MVRASGGWFTLIDTDDTFGFHFQLRHGGLDDAEVARSIEDLQNEIEEFLMHGDLLQH